MKIVDIIQKKSQNKELTQEEIIFLVNGIVNKTIPDYLITSWLMAVYINHLTKDEAYFLTEAMINAGKPIDLSTYTERPLIDKHSTGGIGDKVTMIIAPILAALGFSFVTISGRALGFTGGTIDKLESLGVTCDLSLDQMNNNLTKCNIFVGGQTKDIAPCDKVLYNLRDITGTVSDVGLIASSILSKKFSIIGTHVFIDVKCGSGAFCQTLQDAEKLIEYLKHIANRMNRKVTFMISNMNQPLGRSIGNAIEMKETIDFLKGNFNKYPDLRDLVFQMIGIIIKAYNSQLSDIVCNNKAKEIITSGKALEKFYEWIESQGGNISEIKKDKYFSPKYKYEIKATKQGYLSFTNISNIGMISNHLGAGRILKTDEIDIHAGLYLIKKHGDHFNKGDTLAVCYSSKPIDKEKVTWDYFQCCVVNKNPLPQIKIIKKIII